MAENHSDAKPVQTFEASLDELEKVVRELEGGDLALERSLELFERGMNLSDTCRKQLEDAETRVEMLIRKEGKLTALIHEKTATTSPWDNYTESNSKIINMLYECPTFEASYQLARANVMTSTFTRAPGEAPGSSRGIGSSRAAATGLAGGVPPRAGAHRSGRWAGEVDPRSRRPVRP